MKVREDLLNNFIFSFRHCPNGVGRVVAMPKRIYWIVKEAFPKDLFSLIWTVVTTIKKKIFGFSVAVGGPCLGIPGHLWRLKQVCIYTNIHYTCTCYKCHQRSLAQYHWLCSKAKHVYGITRPYGWRHRRRIRVICSIYHCFLWLPLGKKIL